MSVRQYIGARYVPKFYEFNNGVWESNTEYEPLIIVQYNSNSYTSKKTVPANIGNPSENPDYWAATGNYNAQVEVYRQEVINLSSDVNNLSSDVDNLSSDVGILSNRINHRNIILVGDSYALTPDIERSWVGFLKSFMSNTTFYTGACVSGSGFTGRGTDNTYLNNLKNNVTPIIQDKNEITDIIVIGGFNDSYHNTVESIESAISDFATYVKTTYPNAKLWCGHVGVHSLDSTIMNQIISYSLPAYTNAYKYGFTIFNSTCLLHAIDRLLPDGYHPNESGGLMVARYVYNKLNGGDISAINHYNKITDFDANVTLTNGSLQIICNERLDDFTINGSGFCNLNFNTPLSFTDGVAAESLCDLPTNLPIFGELSDNTGMIPVACIVGTTDAKSISITGYLYVNYTTKKICIKFYSNQSYGISSVAMLGYNRTFGTITA